MKILNFFTAACLCASAITAADSMSSANAHETTEKKIEGYDLEKLRSLPDETIITWALCPGYELGKDEIVQLVKNEELTFEGSFTSVKIRLTPEERHEDEKHIALLWANDIDGRSLAESKSKNDPTEMGYFDKGEKLLLEKGHWNGHAFEYTYRWPGDLEKNKHIKVTVEITVKDPSSEIGAFLQGVIDRAKNLHHSVQHSPVPQPTTIVKQVAPPPPTVVYSSPPPAAPPVIIERDPYGPYYGYPPVVGGIWLGGGWGHHHHWR